MNQNDDVTEKVTNRAMTAREFVYRLFFTRTDDMDVLQVLFAVIVLVSLAIVWRISVPGADPGTVKEGLVTLRWLLGLLIITAVPSWLVPSITQVVSGKSDKSGNEPPTVG